MSNIKVKVLDNHTSTREGVSSKGKPYRMTTQENIMVELGGEVRRLPITMADNQKPFEPGEYELDASTLLAIGRYGFEIKPFNQIELMRVVSHVKDSDAKPLFNKG